MGWACINNLCPPLKIIDQVCLFAVVAFNLLAAEVPRLKRQLNCSSCHSAFAALPFGEADKSTKKPGPWDWVPPRAPWPALGVIEIILSEKSAFKKYFSAHTNVSVRGNKELKEETKYQKQDGLGIEVCG